MTQVKIHRCILRADINNDTSSSELMGSFQQASQSLKKCILSLHQLSLQSIFLQELPETERKVELMTNLKYIGLESDRSLSVELYSADCMPLTG